MVVLCYKVTSQNFTICLDITAVTILMLQTVNCVNTNRKAEHFCWAFLIVVCTVDRKTRQVFKRAASLTPTAADSAAASGNVTSALVHPSAALRQLPCPVSGASRVAILYMM